MDGAEGGTHGSTPTLQDDVGCLSAVADRRHLKRLGDGESVTARRRRLITSVLALATGAMLFTSELAVLALVAQQITKVTPGETPMQLCYRQGVAKSLIWTWERRI